MMISEDGARFTRRARSLLFGGEKVVMVSFGDSITAGFAVSRGFVHFWKEMLKGKYPSAEIQMINSGVCGDTSLDGLSRLDWDVISHRPDLVTVNFGINDMYWGIGIGQFKSNLIEIVDRIIEGCQSEILILSSEPLETPYYCEQVVDYYNILGVVAEEMDVGFVDVCGAWMKRVQEGVPLDSFILPGMDHPNERGYKIIAEELMRFF